MSFDPDQFLAQTAPTKGGGGGFDPDKFLAETAPVGEIESFARGALNNFPLAPQIAAATAPINPFAEKSNYSDEMAHLNEAAKTAREAHPAYYGTGAVAGAVAPMFLPGIGEAIEAAPLASGAALGAANAVSNIDVAKNPKEALKQGAVGAGIGLGTAGIFKGLGALGEKTGDVLAPAANRLEANATANVLDINPRSLYKMATRESGTVNPETVALDINKKVNQFFPHLVGLNDTAASKFQKLATEYDAASDMIGNIINTTKEKAGVLPEVNDAMGELTKAASKYHGLEFEDSVQSKAILDDTAKRLRGLQERGQLDFRTLSSLKQEVGQIYHNPNNVVRGVDQAYSILSDTIDNILDRVSVDNPTLKPAYDHAKDVFKFTSDILPAMGRGVSRDVAGKGGGLTNAALGLGAFFHPVAAGLAYAGKTAANMAAPELMPNLMYKAVNAARNGNVGPILQKAGQGTKQALIDYLTSKYGGKGE